MIEAKRAMRAAMRAAVEAMDGDQRTTATAMLTATLWAEAGPLRAAVSPGAVLMGFMPLPDEIDPTSAMQRWLDRGGRLAVPVSDWDTRSMEASVVASLAGDLFEAGRHGIREPRDPSPVAAEALAVILVPGLAFDASGGRLGRGAGFYDRFLPRLSQDCLVIGVCHAEQVVEVVPVDPLDCRVASVVAV
ncbi:MAG: 5-formyltetrahydrofolate cyclo-ligase [Phycisphaerales bacterium]|jgi:5-formyltetrahydrofolate cyclo-ligase|nr:5-formyltetrahydrofolate cyclo-ligase [Phycisphaerales bacterium]